MNLKTIRFFVAGFLASLLIAPAVVNAQQKKPAQSSSANKPASEAPQAAVPPEPKPGGPLGIGVYKIGMTKSEVESAQGDEIAKLVSPLVRSESKNATTPSNEELYTSEIKTIFSDQPFKVMMTFMEDRLIRFRISLPYSQHLKNTIKSQISEKYGPPVEKNDMKEEKCIYRNGSSFTLPKGTIDHSWNYESGSTKVRTSISDFVINVCPSNLRDGSNPIEIMSLIFQVPIEQPKKPNAF